MSGLQASSCKLLPAGHGELWGVKGYWAGGGGVWSQSVGPAFAGALDPAGRCIWPSVHPVPICVWNGVGG